MGDGAETPEFLKDVETYRGLADFGELWDAEKTLVRAAVSGDYAVVGTGALPDKAVRSGYGANEVRAGLLRHLALGGCPAAPTHAKGVELQGAWIADPVDLEGCRLPAPLWCADCAFAGPIVLRDADARTVGFNGSRFSRTDGGDCFIGDGARFAGGVLLRQGFRATGGVRLVGADIQGDLDCSGGAFEGRSGGDALSADGCTVAGSVFLNNGFHAKGTARLLGAKIDGVLTCERGRFAAPDGVALTLSGAEVGGSLFLRGRPRDEAGAPAEMFQGRVVLTQAKVGALCDARDCWPAAGGFDLEDFTYDRILGLDAPRTAKARRAWLRLQRKELLGAGFRPQPWDQVEKVFREQGLTLEARRIGVMREWERLRAGQLFLRPNADGAARRAWQRILFFVPNLLLGLAYLLYGLLTGFGYFTSRVLLLAIPLWLLGVVIFDAAWRDGAMAPPKAFVLSNPAWIKCVETAPENPAACWTKKGAPGARYYRFEPWLYSFDVFLPVLSLEQEESWEPAGGFGAPLAASSLGRVVDDWAHWLSFGVLEGPTRFGRGLQGAIAWSAGEGATTGDVARFYRRFHEIMGYVLSGFLLAGFARLVRQET